jgi:hypothetical protein
MEKRGKAQGSLEGRAKDPRSNAGAAPRLTEREPPAVDLLPVVKQDRGVARREDRPDVTGPRGQGGVGDQRDCQDQRGIVIATGSATPRLTRSGRALRAPRRPAKRRKRCERGGRSGHAGDPRARRAQSRQRPFPRRS